MLPETLDSQKYIYQDNTLLKMDGTSKSFQPDDENSKEKLVYKQGKLVDVSQDAIDKDNQLEQIKVKKDMLIIENRLSR